LIHPIGRLPSEDVLFKVIVAGLEFLLDQVFAVLAQVVVMLGVAEVGNQLGAALFEGVGDVFEEDQAEYHVLVDGDIDVGMQLVGGDP
jgi:hypothetical protein